MAIFGKSGFLRKKEVDFAKKLLAWKYEKSGMALPGQEVVSALAERVVDDAHRMAKESGSTVMGILKNKVKELKK